MSERSLRFINAALLATILVVILVVKLTILGELSEPFKAWLKDISGHHWVTKGIFAVTLYILAFLLLAFFVRPLGNERFLKPLLRLTVGAAFLGTCVLLGFFTWHFFG